MNNTSFIPTMNIQRSGMSRRNLLQTLAGGLGAGMLAARAPATPASAPLVKIKDNGSPEVVWSTVWQNLPIGPTLQLAYSHGIVSLSDNAGPGALYTMDIHSGYQNWISNGNYANDGFGNAVWQNGLLLAANINYGVVYTIAPESSYQGGAYYVAPDNVILSNLLAWNGLVLYVGSSGNLVAFRVPQGNSGQLQVVWQIPLQLANPSPQSVYLRDCGGGTVLVASANQIVSLDISQQNASIKWQIFEPFQITYNGLFTSDGTSVYTLDQSQSFRSYSVVEGSLGWVSSPLSSLPSQPAAYNGYLYFGNGNGDFVAFNASTGAPAWNVTLGGSFSGSPLFIEDGIAYIAPQSGEAVYAVPLDSQGSDVVSFSANNLKLIGVENGLCIVMYAPGQYSPTIAGLDIATQLHGFACESNLMADNYVSASGHVQPDSPVYRTRIQLVDPNKNPRSYKSVKVWSSDATTITSGGISYNVDNTGNNVAWLTTDAGGELDIISPGDDVSTPALYLWGSFMDRQEAIVIYPDHETSQTLQQTQASNLSTANTYDGSPLLPSGVNASDLASAITNIIGNGISAKSSAMAPGSTSAARARHAATQIQAGRRQGRKRMLVTQDSNTYLSYPDSTSNMIYQQFTGDVTRPFRAGSAQNFTATFDSQTGLTLGPWQQPPASSSAASLGFSWSDFKSDITHGTDAIKKLTVTIAADAQSAAHYIETVAGKIYNITVASFEDAVVVLGGFLKSVLNDVTKAVEWLSYIFDWDSIKDVKSTIVSNIQSFASGNLQNLISNTLTPAIAEIHSFFLNNEQDISQVVTSLQTKLGGTTTKSLQQSYTNNNDPKVVFAGGSYSQTNVLFSKLKDNIGNASVVSSMQALDTPSLVTIWKQFASQVQGNVPEFESSLRPQVQLLQSAFDNLLTDPIKFVEQSLSAILNILLDAIKDVFTVALQAIDACIEALLTSIIDLLSGVIALIQGTIHVPVLSDIWNTVFGGPMSFLDLCAWIIAVPTSIISRATSAQSNGPQQVSPSTFSLSQRIWQVATMIGAGIDGIADATSADADSTIALLDLAFGAAVWIHSFPASLSTDAVPLGVYFGLGFIPLLISGVGTAVKQSDDPEYAVAYGKVQNELFALYGVGMFVLGVLFSQSYPQTFADPNGLTFDANLIGSSTYMAKWGNEIGGGATKLVGLTDFVLPTTAMLLGMAAAEQS
jgi:hypothetical protein